MIVIRGFTWQLIREFLVKFEVPLCQFMIISPPQGFNRIPPFGRLVLLVVFVFIKFKSKTKHSSGKRLAGFTVIRQ